MELSHSKLLILRPAGRLDSASSQEFEQQISDFVQRGSNNLLLDMYEVDYLSSAGLRVLLMTAKKLKGLEGRLILCSVPAHVREVLDLAGFSRIFEMSPNIEQAARSVSSGNDDLLAQLAARAKDILTGAGGKADYSTKGLDLAVLRADPDGEAEHRRTAAAGETTGRLFDRLAGGVRSFTGRVASALRRLRR